ncbi:MAG: oligosaccharide flippase family protein [Thermoanaerobaculia bacterium]
MWVDRDNRETLLTAVTNVLIAGIGLLTGIALARILGPIGRGRLAAIQAWPLFVAGLAMIGLPEAVIYLGSRDSEKLRRNASTAFVLLLLISIPATGVLWGTLPTLLRSGTGSDVSAARWYSFTVLLSAFTAMPIALIRAKRQVVLWNTLRLCTPVLWLGIVAWVLVRGGATPALLATSFIVGTAVISLTVFVVSVASSQWLVAPQIQRLSSLISYGLKVALTSVPQTLNLKLDQLLMTLFLPPAVLGTYVVAVGWAAATGILSSAFGSVLMPAVASGADEPSTAIRTAVRRSLMVSALGGIGLAAISPVAIPLIFGAEYSGASLVAIISIAASVVSGTSAVMGSGLQGAGAAGTVLKAEVIGLAFTAVLLAALLPKYGAVGAAISSLVAYSATALVQWRAVHMLPVVRFGLE